MAKIKKNLIGERFGYLTVLEKADDIISASGKTKSSAWLCKCKCGNKIIIRETTLKTESYVIRSCGCSKDINPNYKDKKLSAEELLDFNELYNYVNHEVMGYDNYMLSNKMVLRLKGMREGKIFQNTKQDIKGIYPSKVILTTFKFCMPEIQRAIRNNHFKDENHKFNYVLKIVEDNLNTVVMRIKKNEQAKKQAEVIDSNAPQKYVDRFQKREKQKINPKLKSIF